jgi:hypothetical protein
MMGDSGAVMRGDWKRIEEYGRVIKRRERWERPRADLPMWMGKDDDNSRR